MATDDIKIRVSTELDVSKSTQNVKKGTQKVEEALKPIKITLDVDGNKVEKSFKNVQELINAYKLGKLSAKEFSSAGRQVAESTEFQNVKIKDQIKLTNELVRAEKQATASLNYEQKTRSEIALKSQQRIAESAKKLKSELQAAEQKRNTAVTQYTPINGDKSLNVQSLERYNSFIKQQNDLYKAGKISKEQYMAITDKLISQSAKYAEADNNLRATIISNRNKIATVNQKELSNSQKQMNLKLNQEDTISNFKSDYENKIKNLLSGNASKHVNMNAIKQLRDDLAMLDRQLPNHQQLMDDIATRYRNTNRDAQTLSRTSINLGNAFKEAFSKFPKHKWGLVA